MPSSYWSCSWRVARRADDSEAILSLGVRHEENPLPRRPANGDSPLLVPRVIGIREGERRGVEETDAASSKETPCFRTLAVALTGSHSYVTPAD
jgi:hypothetical protein